LFIIRFQGGHFVIRHRIKRLISLTTVCIFVWFIIHTVFIAVDGLNDELHKTDVAVVLGNKVNINGLPSNRLQARLDKAVELYNQGYFNYIIVSGGVGKEGFDEAEVMKNYLINKDVPEDLIINDSNGYNTHMTAENAKLIMNDLNMESVMVITQYFHITRTKLAFNQMGFENVYSAHAEIFDYRDIYSIIREFPAFYKYVLTY
jgi:vancomycin permeability regulator SanA